jgi:hypothetical protein
MFVQYIRSSDTHHSYTLLGQPSITPLIMGDLPRQIVMRTVHFDGKSRGAVEVEDVAADRVLAPETQSIQPISAQAIPQDYLRQAHVAPEVSCSPESRLEGAHFPSICREQAAPSTMLRMVPLPVNGGGA